MDEAWADGVDVRSSRHSTHDRTSLALTPGIASLSALALVFGCGLSHETADGGRRETADASRVSHDGGESPDAGRVLDASSGAADGATDSCLPGIETCNGADDDCDGRLDEGEAQLSCSAPNATTVCAGGECRITGCVGRWQDCDHEAVTGCEVDVDRDAESCGACARRCAAGVGCRNGVCDDERIVHVSAGLDHSCAIRQSGQALCWGRNNHGQLGTGDHVDRLEPAVVTEHADFTQLDAAHAFSCGVRRGGTVACWGDNGRGQLGDGTTTDHTTPTDIFAMGQDVVTLSAATYANGFTLVVTEMDEIWGWGSNYFGQLGPEAMLSASVMRPVRGETGLVGVTAGSGFGCGYSSSGVECWGLSDDLDFSGLGEAVDEIRAGQGHTCLRSASGSIFCSGDNNYGQVGSDACDPCGMTPVDIGAPARSIAAGLHWSCAVRVDGRLFCWGRDGASPTSTAHLPREIPLRDQVTAIAGTFWRRCALTEQARVYCWDDDITGDGTTVFREHPIEVIGLYHGL